MNEMTETETELDIEIKKENLEKIRIQNAILKDEYAKVEDMEKTFSFIVVAFKNRLQNLPREAAGRVYGLKSRDEIEQVLKKEVHACLSELSKDAK